jgi:hypothetical protein
MNIQEYRIIGALLLLIGVSFLAVAINIGQLNLIVEMLKTVFRT